MANKAGLYNKSKSKKRKRYHTLANGQRICCTNEEYKKRSWEVMLAMAERTSRVPQSNREG